MNIRLGQNTLNISNRLNNQFKWGFSTPQTSILSHVL